MILQQISIIELWKLHYVVYILFFINTFNFTNINILILAYIMYDLIKIFPIHITKFLYIIWINSNKALKNVDNYINTLPGD